MNRPQPNSSDAFQPIGASAEEPASPALSALSKGSCYEALACMNTVCTIQQLEKMDEGIPLKGLDHGRALGELVFHLLLCTSHNILTPSFPNWLVLGSSDLSIALVCCKILPCPKDPFPLPETQSQAAESQPVKQVSLDPLGAVTPAQSSHFSIARR